jgi:hypothetical protein
MISDLDLSNADQYPNPHRTTQHHVLTGRASLPTRPLFLPLRARAREMLSFVQLLILQGGKESPQFEATFLIAAKPTKHGIATRHFWIEANVAK